MKAKIGILIIVLQFCLICSCSKLGPADVVFSGRSEDLSPMTLARILSELPLEAEHLTEVHDAVCSSSGNGYDEEYMLCDMISRPGAGVGDFFLKSDHRPEYEQPIRDMLETYFEDDACMEVLLNSDMQIYWPYSENWDGSLPPVISFDPGFGAESNYGYELIFEDGVIKESKVVIVDEQMAMNRPVWVVNLNDDAEYTPADFFLPEAQAADEGGDDDSRVLSIESFKALRNYDSWFGGASEFFVKCGAVDGFRAETEEEMREYSPTVTDFMIVVRRSQVGKLLPFNAILLTDYTPAMEKIAFLVTEDDGGTRTSWECEAVVKYKSKSYGFTLDIPYNEKDDIVWRGQLSTSFFEGKDRIRGRFGDVEIIFSLL